MESRYLAIITALLTITIGVPILYKLNKTNSEVTITNEQGDAIQEYPVEIVDITVNQSKTVNNNEETAAVQEDEGIETDQSEVEGETDGEESSNNGNNEPEPIESESDNESITSTPSIPVVTIEPESEIDKNIRAMRKEFEKMRGERKEMKTRNVNDKEHLLRLKAARRTLEDLQFEKNKSEGKFTFGLNCQGSVDRGLLSEYLQNYCDASENVEEIEFDSIEKLFKAYAFAPAGCKQIFGPYKGIHAELFGKVTPKKVTMLILPLIEKDSERHLNEYVNGIVNMRNRIRELIRNASESKVRIDFDRIQREVLTGQFADVSAYEVHVPEIPITEEPLATTTAPKEEFVFIFSLPPNKKITNPAKYGGKLEAGLKKGKLISYKLTIDDMTDYAKARASITKEYKGGIKGTAANELKLKQDAERNFVLPIICGDDEQIIITFTNEDELFASINKDGKYQYKREQNGKKETCKVDFGKLFYKEAPAETEVVVEADSTVLSIEPQTESSSISVNPPADAIIEEQPIEQQVPADESSANLTGTLDEIMPTPSGPSVNPLNKRKSKSKEPSTVTAAEPLTGLRLKLKWKTKKEFGNNISKEAKTRIKQEFMEKYGVDVTSDMVFDSPEALFTVYSNLPGELRLENETFHEGIFSFNEIVTENGPKREYILPILVDSKEEANSPFYMTFPNAKSAVDEVKRILTQGNVKKVDFEDLGKPFEEMKARKLEIELQKQSGDAYRIRQWTNAK